MYKLVYDDPTLAPVYVVFALIAGAMVGSFLKLCVDRWPAGQSVIRPRSRCDACQTTLGAIDLIPVLSYLMFRGRCRHCRAPIDPGTVALEIVTALAFLLIWLRLSAPLEAAIYAIHAGLFILVASIDFKHYLILNRITYPWALFALAAQGMLHGGAGLWSAFLGGVAAVAVFVAIYALSSGGMGLGDVKLAAVVGTITGFPLALQALALAAISGAVVGSVLLVTHRKGRKDGLPFGAFLALGGIVTMLWGQPIWEAYWGTVQWWQ